MSPAAFPPPRRPADAGLTPRMRVALRGIGAMLGLAVVLVGAGAVMWFLSLGLVGLTGLFAHTGAHAGLSVALTVLVAAAIPLALAVAAVLFRSPSRGR